ncbi:hypothetical protein KAR91_61125 [Candidatus Pacearchaeota archaeon]|nr:hypothetical protein [Candidatus Pacearchaeota archaeon]
MASITQKDLLMMAVPIAAAYIANPVNDIQISNYYSSVEAIENAVKAIEEILLKRNIVVVDTQLQEAVLDATNS